MRAGKWKNETGGSSSCEKKDKKKLITNDYRIMSLEKIIKEKLDNYEAPYNPSDWNELEQTLNRVSGTGKWSKYILLSAALLVASGALYMGLSIIENDQEVENIAVPEKNNSSVNVPVSVPVVNTETINSVASENTPVLADITAQIVSGVPEKNPQNETGTIVPGNNSNVNVPEKSLISDDNSAKTDNSYPVIHKETPATGAVSSYPAPVALFSSDKAICCKGTSVQFFCGKNFVQCAYFWNFGDGSNSSEQNPKHIYNEPGVYAVSLSVKSQSDGRVAQHTSPYAVTVHSLPVAQFKWRSAGTDEQAIIFESNSFDVVEWLWDFGDNSSSNEEKPKHIYTAKGNYSASLKVRNSFGCYSLLQTQVNVSGDNDLLAPTGFSPNGDGHNDTWIPVKLLNDDSDFKITIFDKSGNVVYVFSDKNHAWDGRLINKNHSARSGEVYGWVGTVKYKDGREQKFDGSITIADSW